MTALAATSMSTSSGPGSGSGTSAQVSTSGPPGWGIVTAYTGLFCPGGPGDALVRLDVAGPRRRDDVVGDRRARAASCPSRCRRPSRAATCLSNAYWVRPGFQSAAGQKRDESGVSTSSASTRSPVRRASELELRVGDDDAVARRRAPRRARYTSRVSRRSASAVSRPTRATTSSNVMELVVLADRRLGGRREDRLRAAGRPRQGPRAARTPETEPLASYSLQAQPGQVAPRDALDRHHVQAPARGSPARATRAGTSVADTTWLGTMSASRSNHHSDSWVRIRPLSGIGVGSTTS